MGEQVNARQGRKGRLREGYRGDSKEMQGMGKHVSSGCCQPSGMAGEGPLQVAWWGCGGGC